MSRTTRTTGDRARQSPTIPLCTPARNQIGILQSYDREPRIAARTISIRIPLFHHCTSPLGRGVLPAEDTPAMYFPYSYMYVCRHMRERSHRISRASVQTPLRFHPQWHLHMCSFRAVARRVACKNASAISLSYATTAVGLDSTSPCI